jgi:hypothetical protein
MKFYQMIAAATVLTAFSTHVVMAKPSLVPSVGSAEDADKMVVIKDTTKYVNVFESETVLFKVGDKQFAIKFDGVNLTYDLAQLAPAGMLNHKVKIYVGPNLKEHMQSQP